MREQRGHRERRGEVGAGRGRLAVHVLVGGDDHWRVAGQCAGAGDHRRERAERDVRRPRLDVHGVLGERGGAPRREIVDVVEDEAARGQAGTCGFDDADERRRNVDPGAVVAHRPAWVAVLVEVEAVEPDRRHGAGEVVDEVVEPLRRRRVDEGEEVSERVGRSVGLLQRQMAPSWPLGRADAVHRGVPERRHSGRPEALDQASHGRQRDRVAERVVVPFATTEQVGVAVGPVVALHGGQVEPPGVLDHLADVAVRAVVGDEPVAQAPARGRRHLNRRAHHRVAERHLDAEAAGR